MQGGGNCSKGQQTWLRGSYEWSARASLTRRVSPGKGTASRGNGACKGPGAGEPSVTLGAAIASWRASVSCLLS